MGEPLRRMLDYVASASDTGLEAHALELAAAIAAGLDDGLRAARLAGAAAAIRKKAGMPITRSDADLLERYLAPARPRRRRACPLGRRADRRPRAQPAAGDHAADGQRPRRGTSALMGGRRVSDRLHGRRPGRPGDHPTSPDGPA